MRAVDAEALAAHGTALARLENYGMALSTFRRAIDLSQQIGSLPRAGQVALTAFQEIGEHLLEHDLIKHSLEFTKGSITRAARILGISYQELTYMLNTRHKDLLQYRTPARPRRRAQ